MLTRKDQEKSGTPLPDSWKEKVGELLHSVYGEKASHDGMAFEVYGFTYPDELVIMISYLAADNQAQAPVTYHLSVDLHDKVKMEKLLETLVDSIGVYFDSYFASPDEAEFYSRWQEAEFKKQKLFYRVTRENIGLTLQADELLKNS